jgi:hypothetical protein
MVLTVFLLNSAGFKMVVHVFTGATAPPRSTVILVPGWCGGKKDVLGLGLSMSKAGINVIVFAPHGWNDSEGISAFANGLEDIGSVWKWSQNSENIDRFSINQNRLVLGGHSWGGATPSSYLQPADDGYVSPHWRKGKIPNEVYRKATFDNPREQFGLSSLKTHHIPRKLMWHNFEDMPDKMPPYYPRLPNYKIKQSSTFSEGVQEAWVNCFGSGLAPSYDRAVDLV